MIPLHSILVDVDAAVPEHPALEQAIAFAARHGARIKVVDILPRVPESARGFVTAGLEAELVEHRRERLAQTVTGVTGVSVTTELLRGRPGTTLVQEVVRSGHDLVVRAHGRDRPDAPRPFGAVDMELLRHCPCPVWLVDRRARGTPLRILAAVHTDPDEPETQALNTRILDWALMLTEGGAGALTVLQAWLPYGASLLKSRMAADEFAAFVEASRRAAYDALTAFLGHSGRPTGGITVEVARGEPEDVIAEYVETHRIDVVVMGTVARSGLAGVIMGNTAERVLRRLRRSVLAVKPPGFDVPGVGREARSARA